MQHKERSFVWFRSNGEIEGVGTILPGAPAGLRVELAKSASRPEAQQPQILEIDLASLPDASSLHERFHVVSGQLLERPASKKK
jgi:hypothetical protein